MKRFPAAVLALLLVASCGTPPMPSGTRGTTSVPPGHSATSRSESTTSTPPIGAPGTIVVACDDFYPGHCLQDAAWAVQHLPRDHPGLASVTATSINLCPTASPCIGPPHRGEYFVIFTPRSSGPALTMRVVAMFGMRSVGESGTGGAPPPSAAPATVEFRVVCGAAIPDRECLGAAAGATSMAPGKRLRSVDVARPADAAARADTLAVRFAFEDGTVVAILVRPDDTSDIGWASVRKLPPD